MIPDQKLQRVQYVQALTGFSKPAIYKMAREGRIPAVRHGRTVMFDVDAISTWMAKLPRASS